MEDIGAGGSATAGTSRTSADDLRVEGAEPFWDALRGLQDTAARAAEAAERAAQAADRAADAAARAASAAQAQLYGAVAPEQRGTETPPIDTVAGEVHDVDDVDRMFAQARADRAQAWADREAARRMRVEVEQERDRWQTDELTGVLTRRAGEERTRAEIERAVRLDGPLGCVFLDVAGLKAINDSRGHAAGDDALRAVAAALIGAVRAYDAVFRYGGDEFVCVLPEARIEAVERRFSLLAAEPVVVGDSSVGLHFGLAELRAGDTPRALIGRADADMYTRRRAGGPSPLDR